MNTEVFGNPSFHQLADIYGELGEEERKLLNIKAFRLLFENKARKDIEAEHIDSEDIDKLVKERAEDYLYKVMELVKKADELDDFQKTTLLYATEKMSKKPVKEFSQMEVSVKEKYTTPEENIQNEINSHNYSFTAEDVLEEYSKISQLIK